MILSLTSVVTARPPARPCMDMEYDGDVAPAGLTPWSRILRLLMDYDAADTELLIYAMTLVNKTLAGVPDQDTYYDQVDLLEEQGIEGVISR